MHLFVSDTRLLLRIEKKSSDEMEGRGGGGNNKTNGPVVARNKNIHYKCCVVCIYMRTNAMLPNIS